MVHSTTKQSYGERAAQHPNACAKRLLELMENKKSNLSLALDVTTKKELLEIADKVGPYICLLKVISRKLYENVKNGIQMC
jgi:orotidine-5'-phosphate decarboxylase